MKDYFGKSLETLKDKKLYLFDMDGTIYRENELFDGVIELLNYIKNKGANFDGCVEAVCCNLSICNQLYKCNMHIISDLAFIILVLNCF